MSQLSSATAPAVQAPLSITREQKRLEITAPCLLNSRGATTKVPTAKTSSGQTIYANTRYSQPDKKSPSSHVLATDDNASPFVSNLNQQYHGMALALEIANHWTPIPTTLSKVLVSSAKTEWLAAMKRGFDTIVINGTFELCPLPPGQKAISTRWVLKIKHDSSYKARWVAPGFSQHEGIDYLDTYAPVLHLKNQRFFLTYAILMGYKIHSMDVNIASAGEGITTQCKSIFLNLAAGNTLEWYLGISGSITMTIGGDNSNSGNSTFNAIRIAPGYTSA